MRTLTWICLVLLAPACGGGSPPSHAPPERALTADAGADAGCGLSFDDAVEAFAPERVCQTTEYRVDSGYCTHWVACSTL